MKNILFVSGWLSAMVAVGQGSEVATNAAAGDVHFQEVLRLIRVNLPGVTEEDLNRAMVGGLFEQFRGRVQLVTNVPAANAETTNLVRRSTTLAGACGYVGVTEVGPGLPAQVQSALAGLQSTQKLAGLVLDLRFAGGTDYGAASDLADGFVGREGVPLVKWEQEERRSTGRAGVWEGPVVVLVNGETAGAAEALAAVLRETGYAVLAGSVTAGQARVQRRFELGDGRELRMLTSTVSVGDGVELGAGLEPDLAVPGVRAEQERRWLDDPYWVDRNGVGATNRARARVNEAELVRRRDAGPALVPGNRPGATPVPEPVPELRDPVLARAVDLVKGLMVLRRAGR